jgi:predicted enzyme related to lactoylglutathione lyase
MQIPARDAETLAAFYARVFGWAVRPGNPAHVSFEDAAGEYIGAFVTQWPIAEPGIVPYISVRDVEAALHEIEAAGGAVHTAPYAEGDLRVARFRDPDGNVIGIWKLP